MTRMRANDKAGFAVSANARYPVFLKTDLSRLMRLVILCIRFVEFYLYVYLGASHRGAASQYPIELFRNGVDALVEHGADDLDIGITQVLYRSQRRFLAGRLRLNDDDDTIGQASQRDCIRIVRQRRRVDNDDVELFPQL